MEHQHHHHREAAMLHGDPSTSTAVSAGDVTARGMSSQSAGMSAMHMQMSFYWGPDVTILFPGLTSHTWGEYALALLFCFALTVALEALGCYRWRLVTRAKAHQKTRPAAVRVPRSPPPDSISVPMLEPAPTVMVATADRLALSTMFCASAALSYLVMLLVMTFNIGVFLAVVAGHFAGVYLFGISRILGEDGTAGEAGCHN